MDVKFKFDLICYLEEDDDEMYHYRYDTIEYVNEINYRLARQL